jgi:hypothetical protein
MKTCTQCKTPKKESDFYRCKGGKGGLRAECKTCNANRARDWQLNNPDQNRKNKNNWNRKNRDRIKRWEDKLPTKLANNLRRRLYKVLKGFNKSAHTMELIGCSIDHLITHLEKQFKTGMTWDNYGQWHVDHIKPLTSFNLDEPEQQRCACHYTNLQPLWADENKSKGNRI